MNASAQHAPRIEPWECSPLPATCLRPSFGHAICPVLFVSKPHPTRDCLSGRPLCNGPRHVGRAGRSKACRWHARTWRRHYPTSRWPFGRIRESEARSIPLFGRLETQASGARWARALRLARGRFVLRGSSRPPSRSRREHDANQREQAKHEVIDHRALVHLRTPARVTVSAGRGARGVGSVVCRPSSHARTSASR